MSRPGQVNPSRYLSLISTGDRCAVATRGGSLVLAGRWGWRWKDWIDRRFIRKFADLPEMSEDTRIDVPAGLAGEVDVELDVGAVPFLPGALDTVAAGITSSLQPQNLRLRRAVRDADTAANDPRWPLLFDPQTAGGLLASVADGVAESCVEELRSLGYTYAALIGRVVPRSNAPEPITLLC